MALHIYEVDPKYINYLLPLAPHLFHNKKPGQNNERKYVGIVVTINDMNYFAPLSSFKPKHSKMSESVDFIKLGDMSVINLNNMFPVPENLYIKVNIESIKNWQYKKLLMNEYRIIRVNETRIRKNALTVYHHKITNGNKTKLAMRCNDFFALEDACRQYKQ